MWARLPVRDLLAGRVPDLCRRHGEHATELGEVVFISRSPWAARLLMLVNPLLSLIVRLLVRRRVRVVGWPFCPRCRRLRATLLAIGWAIVGLGVTALVILVVVGTVVVLRHPGDGDPPASAVAPVVGALSILAISVGAAVAACGRRHVIAGGWVSPDAQWIELRHAAEPFARQAVGLAAAAEAAMRAAQVRNLLWRGRETGWAPGYVASASSAGQVFVSPPTRPTDTSLSTIRPSYPPTGRDA
jgi:hypothetical protein